MKPSAKDLIIDWINSQTGYKAGPTVAGTAIKIEGRKQIAWLYLELDDRWNIKPGLYLLAEIKDYHAAHWPSRALPPISDPTYFTTLIGHLKNGPKR